jgi:hypothetical protein
MLNSWSKINVYVNVTIAQSRSNNVKYWRKINVSVNVAIAQSRSNNVK